MTASSLWKPLRILFVYRLLLATLYVTLFFSEWGPKHFGEFDRTLFAYTSVGYLLLIILSGMALFYRYPRFVLQTNSLTLIDITTIILLMHANGGIKSGFGILLVITVASVGLIAGRRMALFHPAVATLGLFFQAFYTNLMTQESPEYTSVGILGFTLFVTGLLTQALSQRAKSSEALAAKRGVDLASMEQVNEYIIQHMRSGVFVLDGKGNIVLLNDSARVLLKSQGTPLGKPLRSISPELSECVAAWQKNPNTPQQAQLELHGTLLQLQISKINDSASNQIAVLIEDNAEIAQRLQHMKLASLGRLTASIAHEIRNPLSAISHANQLMQESVHLDKADQRMVEIIQKNTARVNTIIENVLQISRRCKTNLQCIHLQTWLTEFIEEYTQSNQIDATQMCFTLTPEDLQVHFDASQLHQVLTILANNALSYGRDEHNQVQIMMTAVGTQDRPYLLLQDAGQGVDQAHVHQLFEPFFTTENAGTGLGLYLARELSECNYAKLEYMPTPEAGACFRITFTQHEGWAA